MIDSKHVATDAKCAKLLNDTWLGTVYDVTGKDPFTSPAIAIPVGFQNYPESAAKPHEACRSAFISPI